MSGRVGNSGRFHLFAELGESRPHLRFHRADGGTTHLGNLLIGELTVEPKQKHFLFIIAQRDDGQTQSIHRFLFFEYVAGQRLSGHEHLFLPNHRLDPTVPGAAEHVAGGVGRNAKNPRPQIENFRQAGARSPAFQERFLGGFQSIVPIAQHVNQRADEFIAQSVERINEFLFVDRAVRRGHRWGLLAHGSH